MDINLKNQFLELRKKYFKDSELPITFYYSDDDGGIKMIPDPNPANEATYYRKSEDGKLTWDGHEMNGVKEKVMLEISIYLQKIK